jgi:hypothetical protein
MAHKKYSRRDYLKLAAMEPDGTMGEVQISFDRMQTVGRRSMGHAKECGIIVPAILQAPSAIFEGLRRDEDEDPWGCGWRCYCAIPENSFRPDGSPAPTYRGEVYLVFVNVEKVAYNWRWDKADPDCLYLPVGHEGRFKRRLT